MTAELPSAVAKFLARQPQARQQLLQPILLKLAQVKGQALEAIREVLADLPELQPEEWALLLEAAARFADPQLLEALATSKGPLADKVMQKAWKRIQHYYTAQRLPFPDCLLPVPQPPSALPRQLTQLQAYISPVDGLGEMLAIVEVLAGNFPDNLFLFAIKDTEGLKDGTSNYLGKKKRQQFLKELEQNLPGPLVQAPLGHVLHLLENAYQMAPDADNEGVQLYRRWRDKLLAAADHKLIPVTDLLPAAPVAAETAELETEGGLLDQREILIWCPTAKEVQPWVAEIQAIENSPLILSKEQTHQRFEEVIDRAVRKFFPPESRGLLSRRLLEMAYYFLQSGRPLAAQQAQLVARELDQPASFLHEEPFFLRLLVLLPLRQLFDLQEEAEEQVAEQGLIITKW